MAIAISIGTPLGMKFLCLLHNKANSLGAVKENTSWYNADPWLRIVTSGCITAPACTPVHNASADNAGLARSRLPFEVVLEVPAGFGSLEEVNRLMCIRPEWAADLPLKAEGFESKYYKKD